MRFLLLLLLPLTLVAQEHDIRPHKDKSGKYYFFNYTTKKKMTPAKYDYAGKFLPQGLAPIGIDGKGGYVNKKIELVGPMTRHTGSLNAHEKVIKIVIQDKKGKETEGLLGKDGVVLKPIYDGIYYFRGDYAKIEKDGKFGMVHVSGKIVIPVKYKWLGRTSPEGIVPFRKSKGKDRYGYGLLDAKNRVIVKPTYYHVGQFKCGLSAVQKKEEGKYGYIDAKGKLVIPLKFFWAGDFDKDGSAAVNDKEGGEERYIGVDGKPFKEKE